METCYWCGESFELSPDNDAGYHYLGNVGTVPLCIDCFAKLEGVLL